MRTSHFDETNDPHAEEIEKKEGIRWPTLLRLSAFPLALLWMELIVKFWDFGSIWNRGLLYTSLFTLPIGLLFAFLCMLVPPRSRRILALSLLGLVSVFYMMQATYFTVMKTVFAVYSVSVATNATEFWEVGVQGVWRTLPILLLLAVPFVLFCFFGKHVITKERVLRRKLVTLLLAVFLLHGLALATVLASRGGIVEPWELYAQKSNPELTLSNFGVLTSIRLDLRNALLGARPQAESPKIEPDPLPAPEEKVFAPNSLSIPFDELLRTEQDEELREMHDYFSTRTPSMQNAYTGLFADKNLIMITAEAFSTWAIDEQLTPTLYRLSNEGFVAKNFYTPLWWVSTSDGEYFSTTSLIPKSGKQSFALSAENSLPFCMGNQLRREGYSCKAYHNHTYTYYQRDKTHPNMGYDYKGLGNGLEITKSWPESDLEMMQQSIPDYINEERFHAYYMTVSGHLNYSFLGNQMSYKHRAEVASLPYSEESQAYIACQIELDRALGYLIEQLEAAGRLEDTVICLYPDHYPYGLTRGAIEELHGGPLADELELYRSTLILWSGGMEESVVIEKPASNLDLLPTLSNLFGLSYDSRLLMGRDLLSEDPGLVPFSDNSFITARGRYYATQDRFLPLGEAAADDGEFAKEVLQVVQDKVRYSGKILTTDYYKRLSLDALLSPGEQP